MSNEYEPLEVIGHGSFGQIRKVRRRRNREIFVRKEVSYRSMNPKERTQLIAEFRILKRLDHPNIVKYLHHEHVSETHEVHLYMEYCGGGDLSTIIRALADSGTYAPEHEVWNIMVQLVQALYRCHYNAVAPPVQFGENIEEGDAPQSFILHRDIKPENVFLDSENNIKLGDFGLAKLLDGENSLAQTYVGTPYYMSPEVLLDQPSTPASDIWSLGCVIYELCALHPPFQAKSHLQLSQRIREGRFPPIPSVYSSALTKTITACLNVNPALRPTAATLLNLDVMKVHRMERDLTRRQEELDLREQHLDHLESNYRQYLEEQLYQRLESDLEPLIEEEIERRMEDRRRQVSPSRQVRGPRAIHDKILSPLKSTSLAGHPRVPQPAYRRPLDDMSNKEVLHKALESGSA